MFDSDSNFYIFVYRYVIMKLSSLNVVISKVNDVINIFLKLVGKSLEYCFFCKIVDVIVSEKIVGSSV